MDLTITTIGTLEVLLIQTNRYINTVFYKDALQKRGFLLTVMQRIDPEAKCDKS